MNPQIMERATFVYKDSATVPNIVSQSTMRNMIGDSFKQVSTESIAYLNCILYATIEHIVNCVKKKRGDTSRLSPEDIYLSISEEDIIIMSVGSINVNPEISVEKIVQEVIRRLAVGNTNNIDYEKLLDGEDLSNIGEELNEQKEC